MSLEVDLKFLEEHVFAPQAWDRFGIEVKPKQVTESNEGGYEDIDENVEDAPFCPLCECELEEDLSDDVIQEHFQMVLDIVEEALNESSEYDEYDEYDEYEEDPEEDENFTQEQ